MLKLRSIKKQNSFYNILPIVLFYLLIPLLNYGMLQNSSNEKQEKQQGQTEKNRESEDNSAPDDQHQEHESKSSKKYRGKPGTFIFHDAQLKNVLLFFAKTYKLNMVLDSNISGKVTCRLVDVPWDQALDLILRQHGLAMVVEGNMLIPRKVKK